MHSALVENKVVICCLVADQEIRAELRNMTYPEILHQSLSSEAQSTSKKAQFPGMIEESREGMVCCGKPYLKA